MPTCVGQGVGQKGREAGLLRLLPFAKPWPEIMASEFQPYIYLAV